MASLTKRHIQKCFEHSLQVLNKSGKRTPWQSEVITVLSPEERFKLDIEFENELIDRFEGEPFWYVLLEAELFNLEGGVCIAISEICITDAIYNPYEYVILHILDSKIRYELSNIKNITNEDEDEDDEEFIYD